MRFMWEVIATSKASRGTKPLSSALEMLQVLDKAASPALPTPLTLLSSRDRTNPWVPSLDHEEVRVVAGPGHQMRLVMTS